MTKILRCFFFVNGRKEASQASYSRITFLPVCFTVFHKSPPVYCSWVLVNRNVSVWLFKGELFFRRKIWFRRLPRRSGADELVVLRLRLFRFTRCCWSHKPVRKRCSLHRHWKPVFHRRSANGRCQDRQWLLPGFQSNAGSIDSDQCRFHCSNRARKRLCRYLRDTWIFANVPFKSTSADPADHHPYPADAGFYSHTAQRRYQRYFHRRYIIYVCGSPTQGPW